MNTSAITAPASVPTGRNQTACKRKAP